VIIKRIYEHQNLLSLQLVSYLVGLRTYQHLCASRLIHDIAYQDQGPNPGLLRDLEADVLTGTFRIISPVQTVLA
jgi:hypothetical protein